MLTAAVLFSKLVECVNSVAETAPVHQTAAAKASSALQPAIGTLRWAHSNLYDIIEIEYRGITL